MERPQIPNQVTDCKISDTNKSVDLHQIGLKQVERPKMAVSDCKYITVLPHRPEPPQGYPIPDRHNIKFFAKLF